MVKPLVIVLGKALLLGVRGMHPTCATQTWENKWDCTLELIVEKKGCRNRKYCKLLSMRPFITYELLIACDTWFWPASVSTLFCQGWGKVMYICIIYGMCFFFWSFKFASSLLHFWIGLRLVSFMACVFFCLLSLQVACCIFGLNPD